MSFERFNDVGKLYISKASISNRGIVSLSQGACNQYKLNGNNAKYVQLFYDKDANLIGLKFVAEKDGAVANVRQRATSLDFSAKSLLCYYGIMPQKTSMYELSQYDDGMIIIDMKTARERQSKKKDS